MAYSSKKTFEDFYGDETNDGEDFVSAFSKKSQVSDKTNLALEGEGSNRNKTPSENNASGNKENPCVNEFLMRGGSFNNVPIRNTSEKAIFSVDESIKGVETSGKSKTSDRVDSPEKSKTYERVESSDKSKTSETDESSDKRKTSERVESSGKSNFTKGVGSSRKNKTFQGAGESAEGKTSHGAGSDGKSKTSHGVGSDDKSKTSHGAGSDGKSKTSHGVGSDDKSKTSHGAGSDGKSKTSHGAGSDGKSKTSHGAGSDGKSKTSHGAGSDGKSKTSHGAGSDGKSKTPQGDFLFEHRTENSFTTCKEVPPSPEDGPNPTMRISKEWSGGPAPRTYRRSRSVAEKMCIETCADSEKVNRTEGDVMSKPSTVCNHCKKTSSEPLKRCARCLAVSYCSKDCQRLDFKHHKMFCKCCNSYDIARARVFEAVRFFLDLGHARDYSVLLREMPTEKQYERGARCNLLVEILGPIQHLVHYSCVIRDLSGQITKIIFHDQSNLYFHPTLDAAESRMPHSLGSCLVPGHFLLMMGVHWRNFFDGTLGIRINDLSSLYLVDMSDQKLSPDYKKDLQQKVLQYDGSPLVYMRSTLSSLFRN